MKKILLAMDAPVLTQQLRQELSAYFSVVVCADGAQAAEALVELQPELLVVDVQLPVIDGITLVQLARDGGLNCQVIALSALVSDYIVRALEQLEVACLLRHGFMLSCLLDRILELIHMPQHSCRWELRRQLVRLGFSAHTGAIAYLEAAICLYREDPRQPITSGLYPAVAHRCGATATQVEKAIRDGVESAWKHGDRRLWRLLGGWQKKPTNKEFIACMGQRLSPEQPVQKII